MSYPVEEVGVSKLKFAEVKPELVIETTRQVTALPIDVLKAEFPADIEFEKDQDTMLEMCRDLDKASQKPWVLLSAGVDFKSFKQQVEIACRAGASGFLAGRALWQEAAHLESREERSKFFANTAAPRLKELADIAIKYGKPWYIKLGVRDGRFPQVMNDWYKQY